MLPALRFYIYGVQGVVSSLARGGNPKCNPFHSVPLVVRLVGIKSSSASSVASTDTFWEFLLRVGVYIGVDSRSS